jgi:hypothetical protein
MDFDEGIDLSFDVYFAVNEFTLDASFDDDFNTGNTFFTDLLSTVGDLYGENSKTRARSVMLPVIQNRLAEVGHWLGRSEESGIERTNKDFVDYFGLTLEYVIGEDHMNTSSIFDAVWDSYDDDDNLDFVQLKVCHLFGEKEEMDFRKAFMELRNGNLKEKIEYLLAERIRRGDKIWDDLIWRGTLMREWNAKDKRLW